ncbi:MAG: hypothetical protein ACKOHK_06710 [Planctomycetia bacterium]
MSPDVVRIRPGSAWIEAAAGTAVHGTGSLFLAGGSLGLEARW